MQKHRITKLTRGLRLALAVGAVAATSTPAVFAQEGADNTEVIEIRGIRASQKENINTKRFFNGLKEFLVKEVKADEVIDYIWQEHNFLHILLSRLRNTHAEWKINMFAKVNSSL